MKGFQQVSFGIINISTLVEPLLDWYDVTFGPRPGVAVAILVMLIVWSPYVSWL